jgi:hypothetical protein
VNGVDVTDVLGSDFAGDFKGVGHG